jgi:hypothetical protein
MQHVRGKDKIWLIFVGTSARSSQVHLAALWLVPGLAGILALRKVGVDPRRSNLKISRLSFKNQVPQPLLP